MAGRRALEFILPPWTAPDPCEALSIRAKLGLGLVASLFDSITNILIEEHAMRKSRAYAVMPRLAQGDGTGPRPVGPNIMMEAAETREQLTATYPRLEADAEMGKLMRHIADKLPYDYWQQQCRDPNSIQGPTINSSRAIAIFREEALDTYEIIRTELEEKDTIALLDLSNTIRLKLRVLEPLLGYWNLQYRKVPTRKSIKARSTKMDNAPKMNITPAVIAITTIVTFGTFVPLGFAWSHAQDTAGTSADMDFWFLIQNSIMQLLGIFMAIYPISKSKKPSKRPWYWALLFTTLGVACSVGSVPMYLYLPIFWSGFVSFAGTVAQVSMSVQLVLLAISNSQQVKQA